MPTPEVNVWLPAVTALAGALVGSVSPIVVGLLSTRSQRRQERLRLAVQLAIEDHRQKMETARATGSTYGANALGVPPVAALFDYHSHMLDLFESLGELEPKDFVRLRERIRSVEGALVAAR